MSVRTTAQKGEILTNCQVFSQNPHHWFLKEKDQENVFYDIVMPKIPKFIPVQVQIHLNDNLRVMVEEIQVADDGFPGLFVRYLSHV